MSKPPILVPHVQWQDQRRSFESHLSFAVSHDKIASMASYLAPKLAFCIYVLLSASHCFADVSKEKLDREIRDSITKVDEFSKIRAKAETLGLRVYLFGGTAAAFAHYVRWNTERLNGDTTYQPERFDFNLSNIYRSSQDMDIVVDTGNTRTIQEFQEFLEKEFPYFQGNKSSWEVRPLRVQYGNKLPLLGNRDFLDQNNDSNSTGLIEITKTPKGEPSVKDLLHWEKPGTGFLDDVSKGSISYQVSERHLHTSRFQEGNNPPIFSAIRYLTKILQFDLKPRPADLEKVKTIVREFSKQRDLANEYTINWVEKNGKKLFLNAINLENAKSLLDETGMGPLLRSLSSAQTEGSMPWLLSKEPLKTAPLGRGEGRTANDLGIATVTHDTRDFAAFESITIAKNGDANVFISRNSAPGEMAASGDGFYVAVGPRGGRGGGFSIRFQLNPDAREGTDFVVVNHIGKKEKASEGAFVVVLNKAALKVIPESLGTSYLQFFESLAHDSENSDGAHGLMERLRLRLRGKSTAKDEIEKIRDVIIERPNPYLLKHWHELGFEKRVPGLEQRILSSSTPQGLATLFLSEKTTNTLEALEQAETLSSKKRKQFIAEVLIQSSDRRGKWLSGLNLTPESIQFSKLKDLRQKKTLSKELTLLADVIEESKKPFSKELASKYIELADFGDERLHTNLAEAFSFMDAEKTESARVKILKADKLRRSLSPSLVARLMIGLEKSKWRFRDDADEVLEAILTYRDITLDDAIIHGLMSVDPGKISDEKFSGLLDFFKKYISENLALLVQAEPTNGNEKQRVRLAFNGVSTALNNLLSRFPKDPRIPVILEQLTDLIDTYSKLPWVDGNELMSQVEFPFLRALEKVTPEKSPEFVTQWIDRMILRSSHFADPEPARIVLTTLITSPLKKHPKAETWRLAILSTKETNKRQLILNARICKKVNESIAHPEK